MKNRNHTPRKRFGQHFLHDISVTELIISKAELRPEEHILEIGPGEGALTSFMIHAGVDLTMVEIDRDLAGSLREKHQDKENVRVVEGDILECDWSDLVKEGKKNKIVANLPYNISTPLLFKLIKFRKSFHSIIIMLQKEVALRLCHSGKDKKLKDYGVLSVIFGNLFDIELLTHVPPSSFYPQPKVHSSVIRLFPLSVDIPQEDEFCKFVRKAFNLRRKLVINHFKKNEPQIYAQLDDDSISALKNLRPENLTPAQYLKLFLEKRL